MYGHLNKTCASGLCYRAGDYTYQPLKYSHDTCNVGFEYW